MSTSGLEFNSLLSNVTRVGGIGVLVGATSLPLTTPLTVALNPYDHLTIFDGTFSETVSVTASAIIGATAVLCSPFLFPHAVGTPICGDGVMGSLANAIYTASTYLENICQQSLFLTTYTDELIAMPTMRASFDNRNSLHFRPRHWPINTITGIAITSQPSAAFAYDSSAVIIDSDKQICVVPNTQSLTTLNSGYSPYPTWTAMNRFQAGQLRISYTAGFAQMPPDVTEAAILLTSDILAKRLNPMGAPDVGSGGRHISAVLRGDSTGESLLYKRAQAMLNTYTMQTF